MTLQNPLGSYRRTQRELRRAFETFTRANCPTCPTPCCRRPARIAPTDILLAEATGWRSRILSTLPLTQADSSSAQEPSAEQDAGADIVTATATRMLDALVTPALSAPANSHEDEADGDMSLPCEFLDTTGCTFPTDLRPFGCTTFICKYMYARMDRPTLTRVKRLVRELDDKHSILMRSVTHLQVKDED